MTLTLSLDRAVLLAVVSVLACVQIPMDVRRRLLSRKATLLATAAIAVVICAATVTSRDLTRAALCVGATALVAGAYGLLHRVSPRSLGWGDVLLVTPLTLAVAYVAVERVLWWQLVAATTGAVHAVWVRVRSVSSHVPFGPHLLIAAWLMLVASV